MGPHAVRKYKTCYRHNFRGKNFVFETCAIVSSTQKAQDFEPLSYLVIPAQSEIQSFLISEFAGMTVTERKFRCVRDRSINS